MDNFFITIFLFNLSPLDNLLKTLVLILKMCYNYNIRNVLSFKRNFLLFNQKQKQKKPAGAYHYKLTINGKKFGCKATNSLEAIKKRTFGEGLIFGGLL